MGSIPSFDPGTFEFGFDCDECQTGPRPCFLPGSTPKYVKLTVYTNGTSIASYILQQRLPWTCQYGHELILGRWVWWGSSLALPDWKLICRIWWFVDAVLHRSFNYFSAPSCQTNVPNLELSGDKAGDYALITWDNRIDQAAYDAQFI